MNLCLNQFRNVHWLDGAEPVELVASAVHGSATDVIRGLPTNRPKRERTIQTDEIKRANPARVRNRP